MKDPDRMDLSKWRGQNLLGYTIDVIRDRLINVITYLKYSYEEGYVKVKAY